MKLPTIISSILAATVLGGCAQTDSHPTSHPANHSSSAIAAPNVAPITEPLTLKQIMANPDWMGLTPYQYVWDANSKDVLYQTKGLLEPSATAHRYLALQGKTERITEQQKANFPLSGAIASPDGQKLAYLHKGNLFVKGAQSDSAQQLTRLALNIKKLRWRNNDELLIWNNAALFTINTVSGQLSQIAKLTLADKPTFKPHNNSYIAKQNHRLIGYVAQQTQIEQSKFAARHQQTDGTETATIYLGKEVEVVEMQVSTSGRYAFVALKPKKQSWRSEHDIMPDYLNKEGYVEAKKVRARVSEDPRQAQQFVLIDFTTSAVKPVDVGALPGINDDVYAQIKAENRAHYGEAYQPKESKRQITLMQDWGWRQSAINWHPQHDKLLVMFEALDNKDRWIADIDLASGSAQSLHRLHDERWVNYAHNQFIWLEDKNTFVFLSEESGYSHLYLYKDGKQTQLTHGNYVVSDLTLSLDKKRIYYRANKQHPGIYNVYNIQLDSLSHQQLTHHNGVVNYQLSPDGKKLLLSASSTTTMPELWIKDVDSQAEPVQISHSSSDAFKAYPWQAPQIVAIPSSHQAMPIYARVYLPVGYDKTKQYPAVMFTHGAGYLQNAHYGWSGYFREFMFHNLLAQKGYVVMDIDYRGSKGYGRDWRTAQYRQMGKPEVEDMLDGIDFMATHYNVDKQRVGTYGGSYGGFLTFMSLFTAPDAFQAGAALRPVTDWAHYNAPYTSNILNYPDVDPLAYERSSPIEFAQGLKKPLLIQAGVLDDNVFFQDTVRLVQRLIELEKENFETAIYPVERHGFVQPSSWLDEYRRILSLFERNLK